MALQTSQSVKGSICWHDVCTNLPLYSHALFGKQWTSDDNKSTSLSQLIAKDLSIIASAVLPRSLLAKHHRLGTTAGYA
eukprot:12205800-Karenia_brevis.AAC.1